MYHLAFGFAWFERLMICNNPTLRRGALESLAQTKSLLQSAGYQSLVFEDFYDVVESQLKAVCNGERDPDILLVIFQSEEISNQIVFYLRLVTAAYLKQHQEDYEPFLELGMEMDQ